MRRVQNNTKWGEEVAQLRKEESLPHKGNFFSRVIPSYSIAVLHEVQRSYATLINLIIDMKVLHEVLPDRLRAGASQKQMISFSFFYIARSAFIRSSLISFLKVVDNQKFVTKHVLAIKFTLHQGLEFFHVICQKVKHKPPSMEKLMVNKLCDTIPKELYQSIKKLITQSQDRQVNQISDVGVE